MKNSQRVIVSLLLILSLVLSLAACSPQQTPVEPIDGFTAFESATDGIQFQYPEEWVGVNSGDTDFSDPAVISELESKGLSQEVIDMVSGQSIPTFYNAEMAENDFLPNLNYSTGEASGLSQAQLQKAETLDEMKQSIEAQFVSYVEDFTWISEPANKKMGNNEFVWFISTYTMGVYPLTAYQAVTINQGKMYTFTYSALQGTLDETLIGTIEKILSSVAFL